MRLSAPEPAVGAGVIVGTLVGVTAGGLVATTVAVGALTSGAAIGGLLHAARMGMSSRAAIAPASQRETLMLMVVILFGNLIGHVY